MQTARKYSMLIQAINLCPSHPLKYFSSYFYIAEFCDNGTSIACKINNITFTYKFKHKYKTIYRSNWYKVPNISNKLLKLLFLVGILKAK